MRERTVEDMLKDAEESMASSVRLIGTPKVKKNRFQGYLQRWRQRRTPLNAPAVSKAAKREREPTADTLIGASLLAMWGRYARPMTDYVPGDTPKTAASLEPEAVQIMSVMTDVSEAVLISRINIKLTAISEASQADRAKGSPSFGHFYSVTEAIPACQVKIDIEKLGRELGVLMPDELLVG